jgi:hypothetical protein
MSNDTPGWTAVSASVQPGRVGTAQAFIRVSTCSMRTPGLSASDVSTFGMTDGDRQ